jgi:hypothetical protein
VQRLHLEALRLNIAWPFAARLEHIAEGVESGGFYLVGKHRPFPKRRLHARQRTGGIGVSLLALVMC